MRAPRFQPLSFDSQEPMVPQQNNQGSFLNSYINSLYGNQNTDRNNMDQNYFGRILNDRYGQQEQPNPNERFGTGSSLMNLLRQRESGGNYGIRNSLGFSGAYQFGAPALETVGYLKPGAGKLGNKALSDPNNWTIPGGLQGFLGNKELQDTAFKKLAGANEKTLRKMGVINKNTTPEQINAYLAAAHLAGPGGVKALISGKDRRDAYGTPTSEYLKLGSRANSIS